MARYVDGFLLVVPKNKIAAYKKMAQLGRKIWLKHGAIDYKECQGDDLSPRDYMTGKRKLSLFAKAMKLKGNETLWFSFIVFKSRQHRDQVNAKVMKDPMMNPENWDTQEMPNDMKRFAYGGFKVVVDK